MGLNISRVNLWQHEKITKNLYFENLWKLNNVLFSLNNDANIPLNLLE